MSFVLDDGVGRARILGVVRMQVTAKVLGVREITREGMWTEQRMSTGFEIIPAFQEWVVGGGQNATEEEFQNLSPKRSS